VQVELGGELAGWWAAVVASQESVAAANLQTQTPLYDDFISSETMLHALCASSGANKGAKHMLPMTAVHAQQVPC
jgi:hypothetical protein